MGIVDPRVLEQFSKLRGTEDKSERKGALVRQLRLQLTRNIYDRVTTLRTSSALQRFACNGNFSLVVKHIAHLEAGAALDRCKDSLRDSCNTHSKFC